MERVGAVVAIFVDRDESPQSYLVGTIAELRINDVKVLWSSPANRNKPACRLTPDFERTAQGKPGSCSSDWVSLQNVIPIELGGFSI